MTEPSQYIRKAFYQALKDEITYGGSIVPVYESFSDEDNGAHQVMLTNQTGSNRDDKCSFAGEHTIVIDIVTRMKGSGNSAIADNISEQITYILQPTRKTTGITIDSPFQLLNLKLESVRYLTEEMPSRFMVRKLLTYSFRIVQN